MPNITDILIMNSLEKIRKKLKPRATYRREDFISLSSNVDRHLKTLVLEKALLKIQNGLYMCPEETSFGKALPQETQLLKSFLKDDSFVVYDLNLFNSLGLGLTQLHNKRIVFNRKRHGNFHFTGKNYYFYRWREAPKKLSREFLYIEFLNQFDKLSEDKEKHKKLLKKQLRKLNQKKLQRMAQSYGKESTKKKLYSLLFQ